MSSIVMRDCHVINDDETQAMHYSVSMKLRERVTAKGDGYI
jgi:hypothetical protein